MKHLTLLLATFAIADCERPACPSGHHADPSRTRALSALLAGDSEARFLLPAAVDARWCYGPGASGVLADGALLLDEHVDDRTLAARAAHLLAHKSSGVRVTSGDPDAPDEQSARDLEERVAARLRREIKAEETSGRNP